MVVGASNTDKGEGESLTGVSGDVFNQAIATIDGLLAMRRLAVHSGLWDSLDQIMHSVLVCGSAVMTSH
jgi:hypothetical protein